MLQKLNRKMNEKGFTLIELMIVVAIIGILAAIAIPNFRNYQLKAKRGELPTNLKAIKTAEVAYQAEENTFQALTNSPGGAVGSQKQPWNDAGGFDTIGWQPSGDVFGNYLTTASTATNVTGIARSDIDADGTNATYRFIVDVTTPANDEDVNRTSNPDDF